MRETPSHPSPWCGVLLSGVTGFLFSLFYPFLLCRLVPNPPLFLLFFPGVFSSVCRFRVAFSSSPLLPLSSLPHAGRLGAACRARAWRLGVPSPSSAPRLPPPCPLPSPLRPAAPPGGGLSGFLPPVTPPIPHLVVRGPDIWTTNHYILCQWP
ncbi:hypothetical protein ES705_16200 [subsurface metagenome]